MCNLTYYCCKRSSRGDRKCNSLKRGGDHCLLRSGDYVGVIRESVWQKGQTALEVWTDRDLVHVVHRSVL
jgi:hypothetical protein